MLQFLWNTLPILWGNNYFRINQFLLMQTLFIIFWSIPWNATLNTNFSLIGLMETISPFSKHLLSERNLNILLFICLVNHWFFLFPVGPTWRCHIHLKSMESEKMPNNVFIFQTSQLVTSCSDKYVTQIYFWKNSLFSWCTALECKFA